MRDGRTVVNYRQKRLIRHSRLNLCILLQSDIQIFDVTVAWEIDGNKAHTAASKISFGFITVGHIDVGAEGCRKLGGLGVGIVDVQIKGRASRHGHMIHTGNARHFCLDGNVARIG